MHNGTILEKKDSNNANLDCPVAVAFENDSTGLQSKDVSPDSDVNDVTNHDDGVKNAISKSTTDDGIRISLKNELEYYFSRENVASDAYLLSQMDSDQYVPIKTIATFNTIKQLTSDIDLITEILKDCSTVQLDEDGEKVRPVTNRCTIILREIDRRTPTEDIMNLFSDTCPKPISCEFAHNNSWYVSFDNDEKAQEAFNYIREVVKEFQGKPIMARIKAKPIQKRDFGPKNEFRQLPPEVNTYPRPRPAFGMVPFNGHQAVPFYNVMPWAVPHYYPEPAMGGIPMQAGFPPFKRFPPSNTMKQVSNPSNHRGHSGHHNKNTSRSDRQNREEHHRSATANGTLPSQNESNPSTSRRHTNEQGRKTGKQKRRSHSSEEVNYKHVSNYSDNRSHLQVARVLRDASFLKSINQKPNKDGTNYSSKKEKEYPIQRKVNLDFASHFPPLPSAVGSNTASPPVREVDDTDHPKLADVVKGIKDAKKMNQPNAKEASRDSGASSTNVNRNKPTSQVSSKSKPTVNATTQNHESQAKASTSKGSAKSLDSSKHEEKPTNPKLSYAEMAQKSNKKASKSENTER
ncbi:La-related protein [Trichoplax sp. H2]|nr:La-related protein [Trichoplax sp. H2]|eukprot:RDD38304.1 La-related protein [Trichoplax sp. H2]